MKNRYRLLFFRKESDFKNVKDKVVLILSPEFYWIKKIEFDVKNIKSAKKIAPSLFEGSLPHNNFEFKILKQKRDFFAIAYDPEEIKEAIKKSGLLGDNVKRVYFAQKEFENINECIELDDFFSLAKVEDIWTKIPKVCTQGSKTLDEVLNEIKLSDFFVTLNKRREFFVNEKILRVAAASFLLFCLAQGIRLYSYEKEIKSLENKELTLLKNESLPSTLIQLRSIEKRLDKKLKKSMVQKKVIKYLSKLSIKGVKPIKISIKKDEVVLELSSDDKTVKSMVEKIKKEYPLLKSKKENNIYKIWWRYE